MVRSISILVALSFAVMILAADEPKDDEAAKQRLDFMYLKLDQFTLSAETAPDKPLVRKKEPVLRYSNPARGANSDGVIFVWLAGEQPAAIVSMRIRGDGAVWREFITLSEQKLRCERDGRIVWSPKAGGFTRSLPDAPEAAATPTLRLTQLRRVATQFSGEFDHLAAGRWEELRLLPQPIYRYGAEKGLVEGAIFALAQANDPEALLILELTRPKADAPPAWSYAIVRMSSQRMRVRLDGKEVWTVEGYWSNPRSMEDPYQEAGDGKYPGADSTPPNSKKE